MEFGSFTSYILANFSFNSAYEKGKEHGKTFSNKMQKATQIHITIKVLKATTNSYNILGNFRIH